MMAGEVATNELTGVLIQEIFKKRTPSPSCMRA